MNAHGEVSLEWDEDLLIIHTRGPFNEIGAQSSVLDIQSSIRNKNKTLWCKLEVWDDETLGSPSVVALIKEASTWYKDNGCFASAVVISNSIQSQLIQKITNTNAKTFYDKEAPRPGKHGTIQNSVTC